MKTVNNLPHLSTILCSLMLFLWLFSTGTSASIVKSAVNGDDSIESQISKEIKAIVYIESPKVGALMYLRGIAGKGELISRSSLEKQQDNTRCISAPIRFAAGDFNGSSIGIDSTDAIRLTIYSDEVANQLIAGDEVVSEDFDITDSSEGRLGDIKIESGLTLSYGFVLNPGEWSWSSLFGNDKENTSCDRLLPI
ncbi:hypothetical protein [Marinomonas colpomeniae]|uniref:Uncharacterized protein n=1 Tax=Marinomonas colpomeniae TaxID=2774408 RepID=A0ABR8NXV7_9GAMM|nr:hypothetical protein [Marinomonas colpomeniae]MBD5770873.1 hypothetical protein [Marinomonas colpomeniae]